MWYLVYTIAARTADTETEDEDTSVALQACILDSPLHPTYCIYGASVASRLVLFRV